MKNNTNNNLDTLIKSSCLSEEKKIITRYIKKNNLEKNIFLIGFLDNIFYILSIIVIIGVGFILFIEIKQKYNIGKKPSTDVKKEPSTSEVLAKGFAEEQKAREEEEEEETTADLAAENKEEDSRPSDTEPKVSET